MFGYTFWSSLLQEFAEYEAAEDSHNLLYDNRYRKFCIGLVSYSRTTKIASNFHCRKRNLQRAVPCSSNEVGESHSISCQS